MFHINHPRCHILFLLSVLSLMTLFAVACDSTSSPALTSTPPLVSEIASPESESNEPIAILTMVEGGVELGDASAGRISGLALQRNRNQAHSSQEVRRGTVVHTSSNSRVTVVCYNNRSFTASNGQTTQVGQGCQSGTSLPNNSSSYVRPTDGRILDRKGTKVLQDKWREKEGDYGRIPIILSPRNTSLIDTRPELRWIEVPDAIEYLLDLNPVTAQPLVVPAGSVTCTEDTTAQSRVCTLAWPVEWVLEPSRTYFLGVGARLGIADPIRSSERSRLDVLKAEDAATIQAEVEAIEAVELDDVTQDLLLAGLYARQKLYVDALGAYERVLAAQPSGLVYITLGDTYREIKLFRWALDAYRQGLTRLEQDGDDPMVRAAAEFGMGQVYMAYADDYAEAEKHFIASVELYEQFEDSETLEAARRGVEAARERQ